MGQCQRTKPPDFSVRFQLVINSVRQSNYYHFKLKLQLILEIKSNSIKIQQSLRNVPKNILSEEYKTAVKYVLKK